MPTDIALTNLITQAKVAHIRSREAVIKFAQSLHELVIHCAAHGKDYIQIISDQVGYGKSTLLIKKYILYSLVVTLDNEQGIDSEVPFKLIHMSSYNMLVSYLNREEMLDEFLFRPLSDTVRGFSRTPRKNLWRQLEFAVRLALTAVITTEPARRRDLLPAHLPTQKVIVECFRFIERLSDPKNSDRLDEAMSSSEGRYKLYEDMRGRKRMVGWTIGKQLVEDEPTTVVRMMDNLTMLSDSETNKPAPKRSRKAREEKEEEKEDEGPRRSKRQRKEKTTQTQDEEMEEEEEPADGSSVADAEEEDDGETDDNEVVDDCGHRVRFEERRKSIIEQWMDLDDRLDDRRAEAMLEIVESEIFQ